MWSRNNLLACSAALAVIAGSAAMASADEGEIKITEERKQACAEAAERFKELYPNFKPETGVVIVHAYKYNFCPVNLTVKKGMKVRWVNVEKRTSHSVWLKDAGVAESPRLFPEEIWEHTFTASGAYPYLCGPHWKQENMRGYVKVID